MSKKTVPRRPQGQSGPAQSGAARDICGGFVDPTQSELLSSFLKGSYVSEDRENGIAVCLKLMQKVSETTKLKAIADLIGRVHDVSEDALLPFVEPIMDTIRTHVDHESAQLRAQLFVLLDATLSRGKQVKLRMAQGLASLMGPWVAGSHDMEAPVRLAATHAFERCFPEDKRDAALQRFATEVVTFATGRLESLATTGVGAGGSSGKQHPKPFLDDTADARANTAFSSLKAISFMMRLAPTVHQPVVEFLSSATFLKTYAIVVSPPKHWLLQRTPKVRSAVLSLVRDVVELCPVTERRHVTTMSAVEAVFANETDALPLLRGWELLLTYCKLQQGAVAHFPPKFLDTIIDAFMRCDACDALNVHFRFLLPLLALLTKENSAAAAAHALPFPSSVIDEFCGALVEKCKNMLETPNMAAADLEQAWKSLTECWELQMARKRDASLLQTASLPTSTATADASENTIHRQEDAVELFAVMLNGVTSIAANSRRAQRFLNAVCGVVAEALKRVLLRESSAVAAELLATLCHDEVAAKYVAIPRTEEEAAADEGAASLTVMQWRHALRTVTAEVLGRTVQLLGTGVSSTALPTPHSHTAVTSSVWRAAARFVLVEAPAAEAWHDVLRFAHHVHDTPFTTEHLVSDEATAPRVLELANRIVTRVASASPDDGVWLLRDRLLPLVFRWCPASTLGRMVAPLSQSADTAVRRLVQEALATEPTLLLPSLTSLLESGLPDADEAERIAKLLLPSLHTDGTLGAAVAAAVTRGLQRLSHMVSSTIPPDSAAVSGEEVASSSSPASECDDADSGSDASQDDSDSSADDSDSGDEEGRRNKGAIYFTALSQWMRLLTPTSSPLMDLLADVACREETVERSLHSPLKALDVVEHVFGIAAALAPRLHLGQIFSEKWIHVASEFATAQSSSDDDTASSHSADATAPELADIFSVLQEKRHWVSVDAFAACRDDVRHFTEQLLASNVGSDPQEGDEANHHHNHVTRRLEMATRLMERALFGKNSTLGGGSSLLPLLDPLLPAAHSGAVQPLQQQGDDEHDRAAIALLSADRWWTAAFPEGLAAACHTATTSAFYDGAVRLAELITPPPTPDVITAVARTAMLIRALDGRNVAGWMASSAAPTSTEVLVRLCLHLGRAALLWDCYSEPTQFVFAQRVLVPLLTHLWKCGGLRQLAEELLAADGESSWALLPAITKTVHRCLEALHEHGGSRSRASNIPPVQGILRALFTEVVLVLERRQWSICSASATVQQMESLLVAFEVLHHIALHLREDVLFTDGDSLLDTVAAELRAIGEKRGPKPSSAAALVLGLQLLRLQDSRRPLSGDTARMLAAVVPQLLTSRHDAAWVVCELLCSRLSDRGACLEVVRGATAALVQSYGLAHLPSNGRLGQRPPHTSAEGGFSLTALLVVVRSCTCALRGLKWLDFQDDVLKSTAQLILFDVVCDGVSRLQSHAAQPIPLANMIRVTAAANEHISTLRASDVSPLRASEKSITTVSAAFMFVHRWVASASASRLESVGRESMRDLLNAITTLARLTLLHSAVPLPQPFIDRLLVEPPIVKALRKDSSQFSTVEPLKLSRFQLYHKLLKKATKQKYATQLTLIAWSIVASHEGTATERSALSVAASASGSSLLSLRRRVFDLLDLLMVLLLSPLHPERRTQHLEDGTLYQPSGDGEEALGFDMPALTSLTGSDALDMALLSRGAASVLALLLQSVTLGMVKDWVETVDRRLKDAAVTFIQGHISPVLVQQALSLVLSHSPDGSTTFESGEGITISVQMATKTVDVKFQMDEIEVKLRITLPTTFPMRPATVTHDASSAPSNSSSGVQGVSTEKWRGWILKMSAKLFNGSCSLWECVELFEQNIKRHFEGVEPCPICYAVVSAANNRLPEMRCAVCRNSLFHASCLYTWWGNSGQTSCPLCRSPWVSV